LTGVCRTSSGRFRATTRIATGLTCAVALAAAAAADAIFLIANDKPAAISTFTLDFGPYGGSREAQISNTDFILELDAATGSAAFAAYYQNVDPLLLPGDISTGDIVVQVVPGTSTGMYYPETGAFATSEFYAVHFTGDLSAFGLTSPAYLPGNSTGQVTFDDSDSGTIEMSWSGQGELPNPSDPANPIPFSYVCRVNTVFVSTTCPGDADGDRRVDNADLQIVLDAWASAEGQPGYDDRADFNADGLIENVDLNVLLGNWATVCP
jgi:hypothetical protein